MKQRASIRAKQSWVDNRAQTIEIEIIHELCESGKPYTIDELADDFLDAPDDDPSYKDRADQLVGALSGYVDSNSSAVSTFMNSFELLDTASEIVIIGDRNSLATQDFLSVCSDSGMAVQVISVLAPDETLPNDHPGFGKRQIDGRTTVYVCTGQTCSAPIDSPEALAQQLRPGHQGAPCAPRP